MSESKVKTKLAGKLLAMRKEIKNIEKTGRNDFQNYDYVTDYDVTVKFKQLLDKYDINLIASAAAPPTVIPAGKDGKSNLTTVIMQYKLVEPTDPEDYFAMSAIGQGMDAGDKGIYKAMTGAKKYFFCQTFLVPTGDDPEKSAVTKKRGGKKVVAAVSEDF